MVITGDTDNSYGILSTDTTWKQTQTVRTELKQQEV